MLHSDEDLAINENELFQTTVIDYTGIQIPGIGISPENTIQPEWQCVSRSQLDYWHENLDGNRGNGEIYATHHSSPVALQPNPYLPVGRPHESHEYGFRHSVDIEAMEVDTPRTDSLTIANNVTNASKSSIKPQSSALRETGNNFERILDVVEDAGFDSIDTMAAQYYSANFEPNSISQLAQANSRSRNLRQLLRTLQGASKEWSKQETQAYEEEILRSAKDICIAELQHFRERQKDHLQTSSTSRTASTPVRSSTNTSATRSISGTVDHSRELILKEEASQPTQQEKRLLRQCAPETWSLLNELASRVELPPAQVSQAVYFFLHTATTKIST